MEMDVVVRRAALAAIPALAVLIFLLRSEPRDDASPAVPSASASSATVAPSASAEGRLGFSLSARTGVGPQDERPTSRPGPAPSTAPDPTGPALRSPEHGLDAPPLPPVQVAAQLPLVDDATRSSDGTLAVPGQGLAPGPCGGVTVRLITTSKDPAWSFTSIAAPGQQARMRRVGDNLAGWRIQSIEWDRVWLSKGGTRCAVGMHAGAREAGEAAKATRAGSLLADAEQEPAAWHVPVAIIRGIHKRSETEYSLTPKAVAAIFKRGAQLFAGLRLEPVIFQGQRVGVQIVELKPDSLLERLGLKSGDIVLALNGEVCADLEAAVAALHQARDGELLLVRMERDGEVFDLEIRLLAEQPE
jgi:general secretion pathway protein C